MKVVSLWECHAIIGSAPNSSGLGHLLLGFLPIFLPLNRQPYAAFINHSWRKGSCADGFWPWHTLLSLNAGGSKGWVSGFEKQNISLPLFRGVWRGLWPLLVAWKAGSGSWKSLDLCHGWWSSDFIKTHLDFHFCYCYFLSSWPLLVIFSQIFWFIISKHNLLATK